MSTLWSYLKDNNRQTGSQRVIVILQEVSVMNTFFWVDPTWQLLALTVCVHTHTSERFSSQKFTDGVVFVGRKMSHIFWKSYGTNARAIDKLKNLWIISEIYSLSLVLLIYANGTSDSTYHDRRTCSRNQDLLFFLSFISLIRLLINIFTY